MIDINDVLSSDVEAEDGQFRELMEARIALAEYRYIAMVEGIRIEQSDELDREKEGGETAK